MINHKIKHFNQELDINCYIQGHKPWSYCCHGEFCSHSTFLISELRSQNLYLRKQRTAPGSTTKS